MHSSSKLVEQIFEKLYHSMWDLCVPPTRPLSGRLGPPGWGFRAPHGKLHVKFSLLGSNVLPQVHFSRFPVVWPYRADLCAAGVTSVTTSENTEALGGRPHNTGWGAIPCYSSNLQTPRSQPLPPSASHCHGVDISGIENLDLMQFALFTSPAAGGSRPYWLAERYSGQPVLGRKQSPQETVAGICYPALIPTSKGRICVLMFSLLLNFLLLDLIWKLDKVEVASHNLAGTICLPKVIFVSNSKAFVNTKC